MALIRGLAAIAFGVLAFAWPGPTLSALLLMLSVFLLVFGMAAAINAVASRYTDVVWWLGFAVGLVSIAIGAIALVWPELTAVSLLYLVAAWAIVMGVLEIAYAIGARGETSIRVSYGLAGLFSIALGIALFALHPEFGVLALLWMVGVYAIVNGMLWGYCALRGMRPVSLIAAVPPPASDDDELRTRS